MQYIILDMEWNQPWPGSYSAKKAPASILRGEIVQIGAVRVREDQFVADEFQVLIKPHFFHKMNRKVASLTGIRDSILREQGISFPEAMGRFRAWCGEDCVFLTWGFDDITILRENLAAYGMESDWTSRWYNAQLIFNSQTDGESSQRALKTAMELMGIAPSRPAHDALGDAYHTALICAMLNLKEGIESYGKSVRAHENGLHGSELPGCLRRSVSHGFADKAQALAAVVDELSCPVCQKRLSVQRWYAQQGRRYLAKGSCPEHGDFYLRVRLVAENPQLRANALLYEPTEQMTKAYQALSQKPGSHRPRRRRAVHSRKKPTEHA